MRLIYKLDTAHVSGFIKQLHDAPRDFLAYDRMFWHTPGSSRNPAPNLVFWLGCAVAQSSLSNNSPSSRFVLLENNQRL